MDRPMHLFEFNPGDPDGPPTHSILVYGDTDELTPVHDRKRRPSPEGLRAWAEFKRLQTAGGKEGSGDGS